MDYYVLSLWILISTYVLRSELVHSLECTVPPLSAAHNSLPCLLAFVEDRWFLLAQLYFSHFCSLGR